VVLACLGGLVMGLFSPLLVTAQDPDAGLGPYALFFLFAIAVVVSTFVFNLFFMNIPVEGDPLEIADYLKPPASNHLYGLAAGLVWAIGAIASLVVDTPKATEHVGAPLGPLLEHGAPVVAGLLGILLFKEFKGGDLRVKAFGVLTVVLFAFGLLIFSFAPVWGAKL
jgi:glucose uptake protein